MSPRSEVSDGVIEQFLDLEATVPHATPRFARKSPRRNATGREPVRLRHEMRI